MDPFLEKGAVTMELVRGRELVSQLRASIREGQFNSIDGLLDEISGSFTNAIKALNSREALVVQPDVGGTMLRGAGESCVGGQKTRCRKSRESTSSQIFLSSKPSEDGHIWKKYGQKKILGAKYLRHYFRCSQRKDQGCQALKHVQKIDDDPPMFQTTYIGEHSCRSVLCTSQPSRGASSPADHYLLSFKADHNSSKQWLDWPASFTNLKQDCRIEMIPYDHTSQELLVPQESGPSSHSYIHSMELEISGLLEPKPFHINEMCDGDISSSIFSATNICTSTVSSLESEVTAFHLAESVSL